MDPYFQLDNYPPGDGAQSKAVTTTPGSFTLTAGWWYEVSASVPVYIKETTVTTAVSTSTERDYLRGDEWSVSFKARTGYTIAIKAVSASGTAYLRRVGVG